MMKDFSLKLPDKKECFLCEIAAHYEFSLLATLQYRLGQPEDSSVESLIQHGGFCNYHFHQLLRMSNPQRLAGFLGELVKDYLQYRITLPGLWEADCLICGEINKTEKNYLKQFAELYSHDQAFRRVFLERGYVCFPNLEKIFRTGLGAEEKHQLFRRQQERLIHLSEQLSRLENTTYYQAEKEEKQAPRRLIKLMVGRHGIIH